MPWPEMDDGLPWPLSCSKWHIPRGLWQATGRDPYASKQTFCITRHTYTRTISEFVLRTAYDNGCLWPLTPETCDLAARGVCNPAALNAWVASKMEMVGEHIRRAANNYPMGIPDEGQSLDDCHWLPQWMYVEAGNATIEKGVSCDNVLHYESINDELPAFFNKYDPLLGADPLSNYSENAAVCTMSVSDLDDSSRGLLDDLYARDFELLGFAKQRAGSNSRKARKKQKVHSAASPAEEETPLQLQPGELDEDMVISLDGVALRGLHAAAAMAKASTAQKAQKSQKA